MFVCVCVFRDGISVSRSLPLCMWDAASRWKEVWHLSVWHYQWCVSECQGCAGVQAWVRGGRRKTVCLCVCVGWWWGGGRDFHWATKQMVQMWVGVLRLTKARFIQQLCGIPGIHLFLTLHWGFCCLLAHYQPQAKLWTFVCIQHNWYTARLHIVAKFNLVKVQTLNSVRCQSDVSSSLTLLITQWRRGVRCFFFFQIVAIYKWGVECWGVMLLTTYTTCFHII